MKQKQVIKITPQQTVAKDRYQPFYVSLILAYIVIPVFLPSFNTLDSNGPKFLAIAILNMISFFVLWSDTWFRSHHNLPIIFFKNAIGFTLFLFLLINVLSYFWAINHYETLLNMSKVGTVIFAVFVFYSFLSRDQAYLRLLTTALVFLLLFDCLTVFLNIFLYIKGDIATIYEIKSIYSNKNILSSAIFCKIPFALYLIFYGKGWKRILSYVTGMTAVMAILMLSTRAFYLGLVLLFVAIMLFFFIRDLRNRKMRAGKFIIAGVTIIVLTVVIYSLTQRYLFPQNSDPIFNQDILSRVSTISFSEWTTVLRLESWKRTLTLITEHPLTGVGSGNWKVAVLEYENLRVPTEAFNEFTYMYKNHNDFLEITAETGIPGGLLFIFVIAFILFAFIRATLTHAHEDEKLKAMFLAAFGALAYSVDAFFNFPADRPEIQVLFACFLAIAIAFGQKAPVPPVSDQKKKAVKTPMIRKFQPVLFFIILLLMVFIARVLYLNVRSLYLQSKAYSEITTGVYASPASYYIEQFPSIPSVSSLGEPVSVIKAMFLMNENRDRELIDLLKSDTCNPYDSRREYYISKAYFRTGKIDSAIYWGRKAVELKPYHGDAVRSLSLWLYQSQHRDEAIRLMTRYLGKVKTDPEAWLIAVDGLFIDGQNKRAVALLDSARYFLPNNPIIEDYVKYFPAGSK